MFEKDLGPGSPARGAGRRVCAATGPAPSWNAGRRAGKGNPSRARRIPPGPRGHHGPSDAPMGTGAAEPFLHPSDPPRFASGRIRSLRTFSGPGPWPLSRRYPPARGRPRAGRTALLRHGRRSRPERLRLPLLRPLLRPRAEGPREPRRLDSTIGDALTFATTLPDVDDSRMALLGYSQAPFCPSPTPPPTPESRRLWPTMAASPRGTCPTPWSTCRPRSFSTAPTTGPFRAPLHRSLPAAPPEGQAGGCGDLPQGGSRVHAPYQRRVGRGGERRLLGAHHLVSEFPPQVPRLDARSVPSPIPRVLATPKDRRLRGISSPDGRRWRCPTSNASRGRAPGPSW